MLWMSWPVCWLAASRAVMIIAWWQRYIMHCRIICLETLKQCTGQLSETRNPGKNWSPMYFPLILHGPHRKRYVQQFFYSCSFIRCRGNVLTEPLPINDRGIQIQTHGLMGRIHEVRRWDGLRCLDIHTKFYKDWSKYLKVDEREIHRHIGT
jgi:hypothetical protein